jgi:o-succinylbenzoate---CoA ligase
MNAVPIDARPDAPRARALAQALGDLGVQRGHRIGVLSGNTPLHVAMHQAARVTGAVVVPMHLRQTPSLMAAQAERCGVEGWVVEPAYRGVAPGGAPCIVASAEGEVLQRHGRLAKPAVPATGLAAVLQTSGTTGTPRAVAIPNACLERHAEAAAERLQSGPESTWLGVLPLYHIGGVAIVDRVLRGKGRLVLLERFDAARVLDALHEQAVSHVSLVPTMLAALLDAHASRGGRKGGRPPASLRVVLVGGDACPQPLLQCAWDAGWPVWPTYGLTEACSQVATASPAEAQARSGTVGRPLAGVRVRIVDAIGSDVAPGGVGRIQILGPTVPQGATDTGDLGRLDAEGYLFVTGRAMEHIVSGGENVDARIVEAALRAHPDVADACVVGLPDARWGQLVAAAVVLRDGVAWDAGALEAHARARLAGHEVPRRWLQLGVLPRAGEKVGRAAVRDAFGS